MSPAIPRGGRGHRTPGPTPRLASFVSFGCALACVLFALRDVDAQPVTRDPAARGLDVFVHAPALAPPLGTLPVQVQAFGFPTATGMVPLSAAAIELSWDPEHLGAKVHRAPPPSES
jgi:hypothetical protein